MTNWFVYMVEQERRRDEIARAADRHHRQQMTKHKEPDAVTELPLRRHERVLAAIGERLVDWGCRLQTRYRHLATNNMSAEALLSQPKVDSTGCA